MRIKTDEFWRAQGFRRVFPALTVLVLALAALLGAGIGFIASHPLPIVVHATVTQP